MTGNGGGENAGIRMFDGYCREAAARRNSTEKSTAAACVMFSGSRQDHFQVKHSAGQG